MRFTLLSTNDRVGGAARCALRIKHSLDSIRQDAVLLSLRRSFNSPGVECAAEQLDANVVNRLVRGHAQERKRFRALSTEYCVSMVSAQGPGVDITGMDAIQWADVINLHWTSWFLAPEHIAALNGLGKPVIWTLHDEVAFTGGCHYTAGCGKFKTVCRECPQVESTLQTEIEQAFVYKQRVYANLPMTVVTTSEWLADQVRQSAIFADRDIRVLPSGMDTEVFKPSVSKVAAKRTMGFDPNERILLLPSECLNDVRKGAAIVDEFLERLAAHVKRIPGLFNQLRVIFFGGTRRSMESLPLRAGCIGEIAEESALARVYAAADCFVTLSGHDNLPNTVLESMCCSTPVAAFAIGGIVDMIEPGVHGQLSQWLDVDGLAGHTASIISDPGLSLRMGEAGRQAAVKRYSLPVAGQRYVDLAREMLVFTADASMKRHVLPASIYAMDEEGGPETKQAAIDDISPVVQRAFSLRDSGDHDAALAIVDASLGLHPDNVDLALVKGGLLVAAKRFDAALPWLAQLYEKHHTDTIAFSYCDALRLSGDIAGAHAVLDSLERANPLGRGVSKKRGQALEADGDPQEALRRYFGEYRLHGDEHALELARSLTKKLGRRWRSVPESPTPAGDDALPTVYCLETVLGCNLACVECAVGGGLVERKHGGLSYDDYLRVADVIRPHCGYFLLHIWGEPLLNKDIVRIIRHASRFSRTNISTNGHLLDNETAEAMVEAGLSEVIVSIDGTTQDTYARYREKGVLAKAFRGLEYLVKARSKLGRDLHIMPQFIVFEHNQHQMEEFRSLCEGMGLKPSFKAPYLRPESMLRPGGDPAFIRDIAASVDGRREAMAMCSSGKDVLTVLLDGSVVACCYDHNGHMVFGNLYEQDLRSIWQSEKYVGFRRDLRGGRASEFCLTSCLNY